MMPKIQIIRISRNHEFVGLKVYLDGKKYPQKPAEMYGTIPERAAVRLAFQEAGIDPNMTDDIHFEGRFAMRSITVFEAARLGVSISRASVRPESMTVKEAAGAGLEVHKRFQEDGREIRVIS